MKRDEFINNKYFILQSNKPFGIKHILSRSTGKLLCGRTLKNPTEYDLFVHNDLCINCEAYYNDVFHPDESRLYGVVQYTITKEHFVDIKDNT